MTTAVHAVDALPLRRRSVVLALTRIEGRRLLTNPIVIAGAALSAFFFALTARESGFGFDYWLLTGSGLLPLACATLIAANLAALRSRRSDTEEGHSALPASPWTRTAAGLLAVLWPVALSIPIVAAAYVYLGAADGLVVDRYGAERAPNLVELAQGPALVLALGAFGALLARCLPYLATASIAVVGVLAAEVPLASWGHQSSWRWLAPLVNHADTNNTGWPCTDESIREWGCGVAVQFDVAAMGWHVLYLVLLAILAATVALLLQKRNRRLVGAAIAALALVVASAVLQVR